LFVAALRGWIVQTGMTPENRVRPLIPSGDPGQLTPFFC
jgi:hypothetical protein